MKTFFSITNWQKYNPRADRVNHSWLRLENSIFQSEDLFGLTGEQKWFWICLLCLASKKQSEVVEFNVEWLSSCAGLPKKIINETLNVLAERGLISLHFPHGNHLVASGSPTLRTNETDITNKHNSIAQFELSDSQLSELYFSYPRRVGKTVGLRKLRKELKSPEDVEAFKVAVARYKAEIESKNTKPEYIKHFSTFVTHWREWADPETGSTTVAEKDPFAFLRQEREAQP